MMCNPCFMDANQVGYVHELTCEDIQEILDNAVSIKPRRQISVQFSGGEPTISPFFLEATRYAKEIGYFSVQCATNGIRFAQEPGVREGRVRGGAAARLPAVRRRRQRAQRRTAASATCTTSSCRRSTTSTRPAIDVTLVTTIVNTVNNDQVGDILRFAIGTSTRSTPSPSSPSPSRAATRRSTTRRARSSATRSPTSRTT